MNRMIQETPNHVCHLFTFGKDDNFWRLNLVTNSLHHYSSHGRNKSLSIYELWKLSSPHLLGLCKPP